MKIAVWRYGLPLQNAEQARGGGGRITAAVLDALAQHGDVTALPEDADADAMKAYDVAVVLTGPSNPFYKGFARTYERLRVFAGRVLYLQWDPALPFHLDPALRDAPRFDAFHRKEWRVLTQLAEPLARAASKSARVGYGDKRTRFVRCLFEDATFAQPWRAPNPKPSKTAIGYFGSDRPGRVKELARWFAAPGAPALDVWGRWSDQSKAPFAESAVKWCGAAKEGDVITMLGAYTATFYAADPAYVRLDFVAERLFENAVAGVPVFYSNKVQPSVGRALQAVPGAVETLVCAHPEDLQHRHSQLTPATRAAMIDTNRAVVRKWREANPMPGIGAALEEALQ